MRTCRFIIILRNNDKLAVLSHCHYMSLPLLFARKVVEMIEFSVV